MSKILVFTVYLYAVGNSGKFPKLLYKTLGICAMRPLVLVLALVGVSAAVVPSELELDVRPAATAAVAARAYTASVAECAWAAGFPELDLSSEPLTPWRRNMQIVRRYAHTAATQGADLLVLAEYAIIKIWPRETLARFAAELPSVDELPVVPCDDPTQHEVIANLSSLARTHRMYIVANYIEKELCSADSDPSCPDDGFSLFNTDVVFDRDGALIQTYRKYNLFGVELENLQFPAPRLAAFRTDFGAVIGLMTCFDILFEVPAVEMVRRGVTHFAFPTDWGDELPSLTALQMHSAWPRGLGVTLLSSGLHELSESSIGSGIFTGSGALGYIYDYRSSGAEGGVVTATVPLAADGCDEAASSCASDLALAPGGGKVSVTETRPESGGAEADAYYPLYHYDMSEFVSVELTGESVSLCDGDFCCELTFTDQPSEGGPAAGGADSSATYRLLVLNGRRNFAPHWSTRICVVALCADGSQASCSTFPEGAPPPPLPAFSLTATFGADWAVFPSVIRTGMELAGDWQYDRPTRHLAVNDTNRLLAAQLYGRNYALDELEHDRRTSLIGLSAASSADRAAYECVPDAMI